MIEIDRLPRFTLSSFQIFFKMAKELKERLANLPSEKRKLITPERVSSLLQGTTTRSGIRYKVKAIPNSDLRISAILLVWTYQGEERQQLVLLEYQKSNLGLSSFPLFVCPYTKKTCRKLFTDGKVLISRWGFKHTYSERNKSKKWREFNKFVKSLEEPYREYGKPLYRGKLTPYGEKLMNYRPPMMEDLERIITRRPVGRPPKKQDGDRYETVIFE